MKKYILLLMLFCFSANAEQSISIETSLLTRHLDGKGDYNEKNDLIMVEYQNDDWYLNMSRR